MRAIDVGDRYRDTLYGTVYEVVQVAFTAFSDVRVCRVGGTSAFSVTPDQLRRERWEYVDPFE